MTTSGNDRRFGLPDHAVDQVRSVFRKYPQVRRVLLYGSRAMGRERAGSDIDLCVEADDLSLAQLLAIENRIDDLLLPWKVDLALRHKIDNPALLEHIDRVGQVFYQGPECERKGTNQRHISTAEKSG